jgi:hypothetical protein
MRMATINTTVLVLENGTKLSLEMSVIMNAKSEYLSEVDPVTELCLGALAVVKPINYLMFKDPKSVKVGISSIDGERYKRRKLND